MVREDDRGLCEGQCPLNKKKKTPKDDVWVKICTCTIHIFAISYTCTFTSTCIRPSFVIKLTTYYTLFSFNNNIV